MTICEISDVIRSAVALSASRARGAEISDGTGRESAKEPLSSQPPDPGARAPRVAQPVLKSAQRLMARERQIILANLLLSTTLETAL
jgi:hypothetical protein